LLVFLEFVEPDKTPNDFVLDSFLEFVEFVIVRFAKTALGFD
jgi:hypothetical protein